jgi:hypothetical protein
MSGWYQRRVSHTLKHMLSIGNNNNDTSLFFCFRNRLNASLGSILSSYESCRLDQKHRGEMTLISIHLQKNPPSRNVFYNSWEFRLPQQQITSVDQHVREKLSSERTNEHFQLLESNTTTLAQVIIQQSHICFWQTLH